MVPFTLREVIGITEGLFCGSESLLAEPVTDIRIDSRLITKGALYVPITGEVYDGHVFIPAARENGALAVLTVHPLPEEPYILVRDTVTALQKLARAYRERFTIPVIGVTGSVGKTSTKDMLFQVLSTCANTYKTPGNRNNQTGVPQAIFGMEAEHELAVIEMGTNHPGEIRRLSAMAQPDICVLTNIGVAHIEFFGSRENIFRGKAEMLEHMRPNGTVVVNGDDDMLIRIPGAIRCGFSEHNDFRATDFEDHGLDGTSFTLHVDGADWPVRLHVPGRHMAQNALIALAVGHTLGYPMDKLTAGVEGFRAGSGRMDVLKTDRFTIINDSYNANPNSVMAAIDTLEHTAGRHVCILGDMLELGEQSAEFHEVVGMYAANHHMDLLLAVGPESEKTYLGCMAVNPAIARYFATQQALDDALPGLLQDGDTVLIKASRGMHLETTVDLVKSL